MNLTNPSATASQMSAAIKTNGFNQSGFNTAHVNTIKQEKPSTSGASSGLHSTAKSAATRMNQTLYSSQLRQKNLTFNRHNIANIYLNKKGQAIQVTLKNQGGSGGQSTATESAQEINQPIMFGMQGKLRGNSLESAGPGHTGTASLATQGRSQHARSLNESRQPIIGEFLPKVGNNGHTNKSKDKMNITHYYTQTQKHLKDPSPWGQPGQVMAPSSAAGNSFMPYSSNSSSVEAIANRLIKQKMVNANKASLKASLEQSYDSQNNIIFNGSTIGGGAHNASTISQQSVRSAHMNATAANFNNLSVSIGAHTQQQQIRGGGVVGSR